METCEGIKMKTDKEKLIELLDHAAEVFRFDAWENTDKIADYLIERGVTIPVRCGECKYSKLDPCEEPELKDCPLVWECFLDGNCYAENDFCSYGERKEK